MKSLASKFTIFATLMVLIGSLTVIAVLFNGEEQNLVREKFSNASRVGNNLIPQFNSALDRFIKDTYYISELPQLKQILAPDAQFMAKNVTGQIEFIKHILQIKPQFISIEIMNIKHRIIELSSKGHSRGEVEETDAEAIGLVPEGKVSNIRKSRQVVLAETNEGQSDPNLKFTEYTESRIYLSDIKLFRQNNKISGKRLPIFESVTPIYANDDDKNLVIGLLRITYNLKYIFDTISSDIKSQGIDIFVTNKNGEYLIHPDSNKTFAFEYGKSSRMQDEFVLATEFFNNQEQTKTIDPKLKEEVESVIYLIRTPYGEKKEHEIVFGVKQNFQQSMSAFREIRTRSLLIASLLLLIVMAITWLLSKTITKNLNAIRHAADLYASGKADFNLLINSKDEIGLLSKTFLQMVHQINERTKRLVKSEELSRLAKETAISANQAKTNLLSDLQKQKYELENLAKEKDDLLAVVSHDLKNPLAMIDASLQLLIEDKGELPKSEGKDLLGRSQRSARYALGLITDLLDLARLEGGIKLNLESFKLVKLVSESTNGLIFKAQEKDITLVTNIDPNLAIFADYARVLQVINNLISNSLKFTPKGGKVSIETKIVNAFSSNLESLSEESVSNADQSMVRITVTDTGIGIPKSMLSKIFEKYQQARQRDREIGTGLGLTICKNICELHGGNITVESKEGLGSTFIVSLPYTPGQESEDTMPIADENAPTILIVDDSPDAILYIESKLRKFGHKIIHAKNGLEAVDICKKKLPNLVLLDLDMPVMDGFETLNKLRLRFNERALPIIIHSNKITPANIEKFQAKANDYIQKPAPLNLLLSKIQQHSTGMTGKNTSGIHPSIQNSVKSNNADLTKTITIKAPETSNKQVILIDDSEDMAQLFKLFLNGSQVDLNCFSDVNTSLSFLKQFTKSVDVIFLDYNLVDGMTGLDLAQKIRQMHKDGELKHQSKAPALVLLTAQDMASIEQKIGTDVIDHFQSKEISREVILGIIKKFTQLKK